MPKSLTISSEQSGFPEYLDWQFLRKAGIRHIADLSGKVWTDHNLHDPGITILEVLCYALTDLGYRTNFDIEDLLAGKDQEQVRKDFFTAAEVLGCSPLTPLDYRKLLIDIDGVRNAWLEPVTDTPVPETGTYLVTDLTTGKLEILPAGNINPDLHHRITLNGYYRVFLELERIRPAINRSAGVPMINEETILQRVRQTLNEHRNFGEDFLEIVLLREEQVGICADLELVPDADPDLVLQELYSNVQEFLSPTIQFYTLSEMLDKKKTPEQIFEGRPPRPGSHGFIDTEELLAMEQRSVLRASDIYQVILKDHRIRAIRELSLSGFWFKPNGDPDSRRGEKWSLPLHPDRFRPVLAPGRSSIQFFKSFIPLRVDEQRAREVFENRLSNFDKAPLPDSDLDLPVPLGAFRELEDYFSIQHEFPLVYGIGDGDLAADTPVQRKAQARELQAYLTLFDQLLANYLAQLANLQKLFSFQSEPGICSTYFTQGLKDTPEGDSLIRYFNSESDPDPVMEAQLAYLPGETIAASAAVTAAPEVRDELIRQTIRVFKNKTATYTIPEPAVDLDRLKVTVGPWVIKTQANEELLTGVRSFGVNIETGSDGFPGDQEVRRAKEAAKAKARKEAEAFLLMRLREEQFNKTDDDVAQPDGSYVHEHSFELVFEPNNYLSVLEMLIENKKTFYARRHGFLNHLLGRFSERFTDYTLLMYALDGKRRAEVEIIRDKELFLRSFPVISHRRGTGFDYTDLRLARVGQPVPLGQGEGDDPSIEYPRPTPKAPVRCTRWDEEEPGQELPPLRAPEPEGAFRFHLLNLNDQRPLFVSYRDDYTRETAANEAANIIFHFSQPDPASFSVTSLESRQGSDELWEVVVSYELREREMSEQDQEEDESQTSYCQVIVRREEHTIASGQKNDEESVETEVREWIVAVSPEPSGTQSLLRRAGPGVRNPVGYHELFRTEKVVSEVKRTGNTSGLERRVAALMGLDSWQRRELSYLELDPKTESQYGFLLLNQSSGKVLLESRRQDYTREKAQEVGRKILDAIKERRDHPDYQLHPLPYGFDSTEFVFGIGVHLDPEDRQLLVATHPDTFGTEAARDLLLDEIRQAIENGEAECKVKEADSMTFFQLRNDVGKRILTGRIDRNELEAIEAAAAAVAETEAAENNNDGLSPEEAREAEKVRRLREKLNEFLRMIGSDQIEFLFFVDPFYREYYDFHVVRNTYHVASHPGVYQHKKSREQTRDEMYQYAVSTRRRDLYTYFSYRSGAIDNAVESPHFPEIWYTASVGSDPVVLFRSIRFFTESEGNNVVNINTSRIIDAARDPLRYQVSYQEAEDRFAVYLSVELVSGDTLWFRHPALFGSRAEAEGKVNELTALPAYTLSVQNQQDPKRFFYIVDEHAPAGPSADLFRGLTSYTQTEAEEIFTLYNFDIIRSAREYDFYELRLIGESDLYWIYLTVPEGPNGQPLDFVHPTGFRRRVDAELKADQLRQRARLFPVARRDKAFEFFMYPNQELPDFGADRDRVVRRRNWNLAWEDRNYWVSIQTYRTVEAALVAYLGTLPGQNDTNLRFSSPSPGAVSSGPSFLDRLRDKRNYGRVENQDILGSRDDIGPFNLEIVDPSQIVATTPPLAGSELEEMEVVDDDSQADEEALLNARDVGYYRLRSERKAAYEEVERFLFREGFHVVEHLLLSPVVGGADPTGVQDVYRESMPFEGAHPDLKMVKKIRICPPFDPDDLPLPEGAYVPLSDPFSGWATVVLPFWPRRFQNMSFREFFENTLRREAPAHIALRICWVDPTDMNTFEEAYEEWLKALFMRSNELIEKRNHLLKVMLQLTNVYPDANLPSEIDDESEGNVILDQTKLL